MTVPAGVDPLISIPFSVQLDAVAVYAPHGEGARSAGLSVLKAQQHRLSVEALCGQPGVVCLGCAGLHKAAGAPGSMHWSYQGPGFKFATCLEGSLFFRAVPEPFFVQRAKRIKGIFPTLLIIFLGPIS